MDTGGDPSLVRWPMSNDEKREHVLAALWGLCIAYLVAAAFMGWTLPWTGSR